MDSAPRSERRVTSPQTSATQSSQTPAPPPPRVLNDVVVEQMRRHPVHAVVRDLTSAARDAKLLPRTEFRRLVAYLAEQADGRDRREPVSTRSGDARQIPRLRLLMEQCFGVYADLHWFRINKAANQSGQPLRGVYPRAAAAFARVPLDRFAALTEALLSDQPDGALQRVLQETQGRVPGLGAEVFSWLCHLYRRDLYFVVPRSFGESSGMLQFIGNDLRRYLAVTRDLRRVCDELGFPGDLRGSAMLYLLDQPSPPARLRRAVHDALGPSVAGRAVLGRDEADSEAMRSDAAAQPIEYAVRALRMRRGPTSLREQLLEAYGDACAMSGSCIRDLLEVAWIVPFPDGEVHAPRNALLLRSDLHTLFDLNLIGVDPDARVVHVSPELSGSGYRKLHGRTLTLPVGSAAPDGGLLRDRWAVFRARTAAEGEEAVAAAPAAPAEIDVRAARESTEEVGGSVPPVV